MNFLGDVIYPGVPGHEIVGVVTQVGSRVTKFKIGDRVGVGFVAMSCQECESCIEGSESMCEKPMIPKNSRLAALANLNRANDVDP